MVRDLPYTIKSSKQPKRGCFIGRPTGLSRGDPVLVDGESRGEVIGVHAAFLPRSNPLIAMRGDDGNLYYAYYRPAVDSPLSWKAGAESLPWVQDLLANRPFRFE